MIATAKGQQLRLITANFSGKSRTATLNGRRYIVVPVTMIVTGVLNGSKGSLFYPLEEVARDPGAWNNMPLVVNHPEMDGVPVSARIPEMLEKFQVGHVFNAHVRNGKLRAEGWFDVEKTKHVNRKVLLNLERGVPMECSTGLFTDNDPTPGTYNGREFTHIARNYRPDHLAVLPDKRGACSIEDGCGISVENSMAKKPKLGTGQRFAQLKGKLGRKGVRDPGALAAYIGRKKYGKKKFARLGAHGRHTANADEGHWITTSTGNATSMSVMGTEAPCPKMKKKRRRMMLENSFPGHKGRPGHRGGSSPRDHELSVAASAATERATREGTGQAHMDAMDAHDRAAEHHEAASRHSARTLEESLQMLDQAHEHHRQSRIHGFTAAQVHDSERRARMEKFKQSHQRLRESIRRRYSVGHTTDEDTGEDKITIHQATHNGEHDMRRLTVAQRDELIDSLITNCDCEDEPTWNDDDREALEHLSDNRLLTLVENASREKDGIEGDVNDMDDESDVDEGYDELEDTRTSKKGDGRKHPSDYGTKGGTGAARAKGSKGETGSKEGGEVGGSMAKNEAAITEWLEKTNAPAPVRQMVQNQMQQQKQERLNLIKRITANANNTFKSSYLASKDMEELRAIAKLAGNSQPVENGRFLDFSGAAGGAVFNQDTSDLGEPLDTPTTNWAEIRAAEKKQAAAAN